MAERLFRPPLPGKPRDCLSPAVNHMRVCGEMALLQGSRTGRLPVSQQGLSTLLPPRASTDFRSLFTMPAAIDFSTAA